MKKLTVIYNDMTLFDDDIDEFVWQETNSGVTAQGKIKKASASSGGFFNALASARKQQTEQTVKGFVESGS
jgi:hypothetical protein